MRILDIFRSRKQESSDTFVEDMFARIDELKRNSPATKAQQCIERASDALSTGDLSAAWRLYLEAKDHYLSHATQCNYSRTQLIDLDSSMSAPLAEVLRREGRHFDALSHIVYWAAGTENPMKMHDQRVASFFKQCKFRNATLEDVLSLVSVSRLDPDFVKIRDAIGAWRAAE
jgi:hypothetical protein